MKLKNIFIFSLFATLIFAACGDDNGTSADDGNSSSSGLEEFSSSSGLEELSSSSFDSTNSSSSQESPESSSSVSDVVTSISKKTITGVSQKGPFVNGSEITVQELDGETLAQTGKSFLGDISNDKGEFSVSNVSLISPFALIKADGYYRNEVTGKQSGSRITLYALTDLSDREKVNVNLLTHLEYKRALYLATENGMTVSEAKQQASKEVLEAFGITSEVSASEDLSIFNAGESNAALLAISILLQGNRSEAELSELLANFVNDIERDGIWNDSATQTILADWEFNNQNKFSAIRTNMENWKLGTVPDFEKYLQAFMLKTFDLAACNAAQEGALIANPDTTSSITYVVCSDGSYRTASAAEILAEAICSKELENQMFLTPDNSIGYVCSDGSYRRASVAEILAGAICSDELESQMFLTPDNSIGFVCSDGSYRTASAAEILAGAICSKELENQMFLTPDNSIGYVCSDGSYRRASTAEILAGAICSEELENRVFLASDNSSGYVCSDGGYRTASTAEILVRKSCTAENESEFLKSQSSDEYFVCMNGRYRPASAAEILAGAICSEDLENRVFLTSDNSSGYVCSDGSYRTASIGEVFVGEICSAKLEGEVFLTPEKTSGYICSNGSWLGALKDDRDDQVYYTTTIGDQIWMAENLNYEAGSGSLCYDNDPNNCNVYGRLYDWATVMNLSRDCNDKECTELIQTPHQGICPNGWHVPSDTEWGILEISVRWSAIRLKATNGWNESGNGTDNYGFSALPGGYFKESFESVGYTGGWWTTSEDSASNAYSRIISYYQSEFFDYILPQNENKVARYSLRCVKDIREE